MSSLSNFLYTSQLDKQIEDKKDVVLLFLCRRGVSFTTEIARQCDISMEGINQLLYNLNRFDFIQKVFPNPQIPQAIFRCRLAEFWSQGIIGFDSISRFSWWTININGLEFLQAKYKGEKKPIARSLVEFLELEEVEQNGISERV